jgi:hypothetical protein
MHKIKEDNKKPNSLVGLFFIGLILIVIFFIGGSASLLKQNITNWPKARAEVISVEHKIVCETPERSGACYAIFFVKYSYYVNGKKYTSQMEQMYGTSYSPGKTLDVYYKKDNPQLVFVNGKIPTKFDLFLPLISERN